MRKKSIASEPATTSTYLIGEFKFTALQCFEAYLDHIKQPVDREKENQQQVISGMLVNHKAELTNIMPTTLLVKMSKKDQQQLLAVK